MKLASLEMNQPLIVFACVGDNSGRGIEITLQLVGRLLWRSDQGTAAVVDPAGDERVDESSGRDVVKRVSDAAQLSKLEKTLGTDCSDVLVKGQIRRQ